MTGRVWTHCGLAISLIASGCAVGGKHFSYDSQSRMPWFGLQLTEPKSKEPAIYRSISREAPASEPPAVNLALQKTEEPTRKWPKWLGGESKSAIVLPVSKRDDASQTADLSASVSFE